MSTPEMSEADAALEAVIEDLRLRLMYAVTPSERGRVLRDLERAISNRTPAAVACLEARLGSREPRPPCLDCCAAATATHACGVIATSICCIQATWVLPVTPNAGRNERGMAVEK